MANPAWCKTEQGKGCPPVILRVLVALCASRALRFGGVREMAVQPRKGRTESGLQGSGTPPPQVPRGSYLHATQSS